MRRTDATGRCKLPAVTIERLALVLVYANGYRLGLRPVTRHADLLEHARRCRSIAERR